ncbi:MAG: patatin-like phospholipase family protein [Pseudomonadota bacterium]
MANKKRRINLALQGGGAHGAFTWGVLDKVFEDDRLWIEALSGTSAGAMNAVVAAQGMYDGGAEGAREALREFWWQVSKSGQNSPLRRSPLDLATGNWSLDHSPGYIWMDMLSRFASPYDLNPIRVDPLRDLVEAFVDFDKVRDCTDMHLFVSATNVETGRVRVFRRNEVTLDVVMASACLPSVFHAVEIEGVPYWDGGYMGNPVLLPFIDESPCADIMIIQINPIERPGIPRSAREIQNRVNEITFNSSLMKELRMIHLVDRLLDEGKLPAEEFRHINVHIVEAQEDLNPLTASSKMNTEWSFLEHLHEVGRAAATRWMDAHFDDLGARSTVDLGPMFEATY